MIWWMVLLLVGSVQASEPVHLKPGALVGHLGHVALVEDVLWVKYPHATLASIPSRLKNLIGELDASLAQMEMTFPQSENITLLNDPTIVTLMKKRLAYVNETVGLALESYLAVDQTTRVKRGYVDGIGELSRTLFGTAMNKDVVALRHRYNYLAQIATANKRACSMNSKNLARLDQHVKDLGVYVNILQTSLNVVVKDTGRISHILLIMQALPALENHVNSLMHANQLVMRNLVDAVHGRVTPSLFPISDLRHSLRLGKVEHGLNPLFNQNGLQHYYPLLESFVTHEEIVIHVPFQSKDIFQVHQLEPFPFKANNTLMTLDMPPSIVLISMDFTLYATAEVSDLERCKTEVMNYYHCPSSLFAFMPVSGGLCEVELTRKDASKALSLCPYTEVAPKPLFHKRFFSHHYFFFLKPFYISVVCPDETTYREVTGHLAVYTACHVRSANLTTFPSRLYKGFSKNATTRVFPLTGLDNLTITSVKYVTNRISEFQFSNVSEIETVIQDSLPMYLAPYVHFPSLIAPIIIFVILLIPLCCWVRQALSLYRLLEQRRTAAVRTQDTGV